MPESFVDAMQNTESRADRPDANPIGRILGKKGDRDRLSGEAVERRAARWTQQPVPEMIQGGTVRGTSRKLHGPLLAFEARRDKREREPWDCGQGIPQPPGARTRPGRQDIRRGMRFSDLGYEETARSSHPIEGLIWTLF